MKEGYRVENWVGIIPEGTKVIAAKAFADRTDLSRIEIPDSVTEIGDFAFSGCTNLICIRIPKSVKKIGFSAFARCSSITYLDLPNTVEIIDDRAFADCTGLHRIFLPSIEELKSWAFAGCTGLTDIEIPITVKVIGNAFTGCTGLTRIRIPRSVNLIDDTAFQGCTSLSVVEFMGKVEEIGEGLFSDCDHLSKILVPAGLADFYKNRLDEEVHNLIEEKYPVVYTDPNQVLSVTYSMTVGEFCHFFDYLFDGKAEVRIHYYKHRQKDDESMKHILNPDHAAELALDSSMTVGKAEKVLTACVDSDYSVNIYPQNRCYRITKDMSLKDIKHLQAEPIESNNNYPEKAEDINMISQTFDIDNVPDTRWTMYIYFESKGKYYVWKRWADRVDGQVVDGKDNISLEEYKYGKLFELCIECDVEKIFNHIENELGFALGDKRKERIKNLIIKGLCNGGPIPTEEEIITRHTISDSMSTAEAIVEYITSNKTEEEWDAIYKKRQEDSEADDEDSTAADWYSDAWTEITSIGDTEEKKLFEEVWWYGTYRDEWYGELSEVYNKKS